MRALLTVLIRELRERWPVAAAGLAVGLVPLALPLLPSVARHGARSVREAATVVLFWLASLLFAAALGGSVFNRDLAERRLGFYFSRPLAGWQIWAGKLAAAAVLTAVASGLVLVPTVLIEGLPSAGGMLLVSLGTAGLLGLWGTVIVATVCAAHAVRLALAARTAWLALDLVMLMAVVALVARSAERLLQEWAIGASLVALFGLAAACLVALLWATYLQITLGRVSLGRGHRMLSVGLWSLVLAAALGCVAFAEWVLGSSPRDLTRLHFVEPAPAGDWVWLGGTARAGHLPSFLFNLSTGRWLPTGSERLEAPGGGPAAFATDGSAAVWFDYSMSAARRAASGRLVGELILADLAGADPRAAPLPGPHDYPERLALGPGGAPLVTGTGGALEIVRPGRPGAALRHRLPGSWFGQLAVTDRGILVAGTDCGADGDASCDQALWWVDPAKGGAATELARTPAPERIVLASDWVSLEVDGAEALALPRSVVGAGAGIAFRVDLSTLEVSEIELPPSPEKPWRAGLLEDGRLLLVRSTAREQLAIVDRAGGVERTVTLDGASRVVVGGEPVPGLLLVGAIAPNEVSGGEPGRESTAARTGRWTSWVLDLATGELREIGRGLEPAGHPGLGPNAAGSRLLRRGDGELLLLDIETLAVRTVLGGE